MFKILKKSNISKARLGIIKTPHGLIETPFFMPDATHGQVKNLCNSDLIGLDLKSFVANTLHLYLRPGLGQIKRAGGLRLAGGRLRPAVGGLHEFVNWRRSILSDSGGYQVYSLIHKDKSGANGKITDQGAIFKSPLDGSRLELTPEQSIRIQFALGVDMMVCFDDCPPNNYNDASLEIAVRRTILWAKRCRAEYEKNVKRRLARDKNYKRPLIFAVIQGGNNLVLREFCSKELIKIGFDGFGFGARHVDEEGNFLENALTLTAEKIPENKLRFGLGLGKPEDIIRAVKMGWDMFDCVIPTREGRHGRLFLKKRMSNDKFTIAKASKYYETINITNAKFAKDFSPINSESKFEELRTYSKAYLRYLFKINEASALRLASLNNLEFYLKMLSEIRELIKKNKF